MRTLFRQVLIMLMVGLLSSAWSAVYANSGQQTTPNQADQIHSTNKTQSKDTKIKALQALRLHNITRNYQDQTLLRNHDKTNHKQTHSAHVSRQEKLARVRQWESVYQ